MTTEKKEKKVRVARNVESILKGALSLSLEDRNAICLQLKASINEDVKKLQEAAAKAGELINNL